MGAMPCNRDIDTIKRSPQKYHRKCRRSMNAQAQAQPLAGPGQGAEWERSAVITSFRTAFLGNICSAKAGGFVSWLRIQQKREGTVQKHPGELKHHGLKWLHQSICRSDSNLEMHFLALGSTTIFNFNFKGHPLHNLDVVQAAWARAFQHFFWLFLFSWTAVSFGQVCAAPLSPSQDGLMIYQITGRVRERGKNKADSMC